jgi:hypothetical protein
MVWEKRKVKYIMKGVNWINRKWVLEVKLEGEDWFEKEINMNKKI